MARTFIRQDTQIRGSDLYDDSLAAGVGLETQASIEGDLNALRSQLKRAIYADAVGDWFADIPTVNGKKRALAGLSVDLDDVEEKRLLFHTQVLTDITVTAAQNWEILSVAGSEAPTEVRASGVTTKGAVTATSAFSGAGFNVHELAEVAGANPISPKNLCAVRDAVTGQPIQSSGRDVFALLQGESTGVDGAAFDDVSGGNRAKLSFVRMNAGFDDLEACPVADIAGKTINYVYVKRINFDAVPENAFLGSVGFTDQTAAVDITRQRAYDNQGAVPVTTTANASLSIGQGHQWNLFDDVGGTLLRVISDNAGGNSQVFFGGDVDVFASYAIVNTFDRGLTTNALGTRPIRSGVNDGVIETTAGDLRILGFAELFLDDGNQAGSTWAQVNGIKLSETTAEWDAFEVKFGETSLLDAITKARRNSKVYANVTADANADIDVGGAGGGANLDAQLPNMSAGNFLVDYDVFHNGTLLRPGADAAANNDYYPGTSLALGQLKFEFKVKTGDVLCVIPYA